MYRITRRNLKSIVCCHADALLIAALIGGIFFLTMTIKLQTERIAVLPLGAHEAHGPHLPFETDSIIAKAVSKRAAELLSHVHNIVFLPVEEIGYSIEHMRVKGTKSLSWKDAVERWIAIGENQYKQGIRKFVMLNAHGGNSAIMNIVSTELRARFPMLAVTTSWTRFGIPAGIIDDADKALDIHAGFIETSVMLAIAPDRVDMTQAQNFSNRQADCICSFNLLRAYGPHAFGWLMQDLNSEGAAGNAKAANAEDGEKILNHAVSGFMRLLEDVNRFDLNWLA